MKPIMSRLTTITPFLFFPLYMLFLKKRKLAYFVVALLAISISSCYLHYYKTNSSKTVDAATIQKLMYANKYFILHSGNNAYALTHIKTSNDVLEGDADTLADQHGFYLHPKNSDANRFSAEDKS